MPASHKFNLNIYVYIMHEVFTLFKYIHTGTHIYILCMVCMCIYIHVIHYKQKLKKPRKDTLI